MKISRLLLSAALFAGVSSYTWASHDDQQDPNLQPPAAAVHVDDAVHEHHIANPGAKLKGCKRHAREELNEMWKQQRQFPKKMANLKELPKEVDLTMFCGKRFNQGNLGSCTANAISLAFYMRQIIQAALSDGKWTEEELTKLKAKAEYASRLWIYFYERKEEGNIFDDTGAYIGTGMEVMAKKGACTEKYWPYSDSTTGTRGKLPPYQQEPNFLAQKNVTIKDTDGLKRDMIVPKGNTVNDIKALKTALAAYQPVVVGITVYPGFMGEDTANTGYVPMPQAGEEADGGHAVLIAGYKMMKGPKDDKEYPYFILVNSWGTDWGAPDRYGDRGLFFLREDFIANLDYSNELWQPGKVTQMVVNPRKAIAMHALPAPEAAPIVNNNNNNNNNEDEEKN